MLLCAAADVWVISKKCSSELSVGSSDEYDSFEIECGTPELSACCECSGLIGSVYGTVTLYGCSVEADCVAGVPTCSVELSEPDSSDW